MKEIAMFTIEETCTILDAMKRLDSVSKKILFIVTDDKLIATLTDGDIRRWILKKGELNAEVRNAANYTPKYLMEGNRQEAFRFMRENQIEALPIVDESKNIKRIFFLNDKEFVNTQKNLTLPVVMMAGGFGKRLYPYTNILPKPLIPIGEIPIAEHIINQFHEYGCSEFYLVVNHKKNMIKAYFNEIEKDYNVHYADENIPLGTGGGLSLLKGKVSSTFVLTNCDILIQEDFSKIYRMHKEQNHIITMICSLKNFTVPYGIVEIGNDGYIEGMKEKPTLSFFTNTGCYIVEPEVIEDLEDNIKISFPDIIDEYRKQGKKVGVYPIGENSWMDMGQLDELEKMRNKLEK